MSVIRLGDLCNLVIVLPSLYGCKKLSILKTQQLTICPKLTRFGDSAYNGSVNFVPIFISLAQGY